MIGESTKVAARAASKNEHTGSRPVRKFLFVVSSLGVGGIETYILSFLRYAGTAIDVTVLCKSGLGGALEAEYRELGVKIVLLRIGTSVSVKYFYLFNMLWRGRFDGVCDFTGDFAGLVMLTARLAGVRTRLTFYRGSEYQFLPTPFRIAVARFLGWLVRTNASKILSNSEVALDRFHPRRADRLERYRVIRNPAPNLRPLPAEERAELRREAAIPDNAIVIVHVGRVAAPKNHTTILAIIQLVLERHSNVWAVLIGSGTGDFCEPRVPTHLAGRVKTFEHRSDVPDFLQVSDIFLFPSLNEGMPNAMIEAMAAGCPVVASNIPAIKEVFPVKYTGYLFEPTDVAAGVDRIERLIAFPDTSYGPNLAEWVMHSFTLEATFGAFLAELDESLRIA